LQWAEEQEDPKEAVAVGAVSRTVEVDAVEETAAPVIPQWQSTKDSALLPSATMSSTAVRREQQTK
jgi:hypothetical protein